MRSADVIMIALDERKIYSSASLCSYVKKDRQDAIQRNPPQILRRSHDRDRYYGERFDLDLCRHDS